MKKVFFIISLAAFSFASAQNNNRSPILPTPKANSLETPRFYVIDPPQPKLAVPAQLVNTLANGNKIYALSQDNMPCVVPDISQYNMPVSKPNITYTIPNPALPQPPSDKPVILMEDQVKKLLEMQKQHQ